MGVIFTITPGLKTVVQQCLDDFITEFGKPCMLFYPPKMDPCPNCIYDPRGKKSSNHFLNGGPIPFSEGTICPMCGGRGMRADQASEAIRLLCAWEPKNFWYPMKNIDIRVPYSIVQTKGYLSDYPKLRRCDYLQFETSIAGILNQKYRMLGEGGDRSNIIQGRYVVVTWERAG